MFDLDWLYLQRMAKIIMFAGPPRAVKRRSSLCMDSCNYKAGCRHPEGDSNRDSPCSLALDDDP